MALSLSDKHLTAVEYCLSHLFNLLFSSFQKWFILDLTRDSQSLPNTLSQDICCVKCILSLTKRINTVELSSLSLRATPSTSSQLILAFSLHPQWYFAYFMWACSLPLKTQGSRRVFPVLLSNNDTCRECLMTDLSYLISINQSPLLSENNTSAQWKIALAVICLVPRWIYFHVRMKKMLLWSYRTNICLCW